IRDDLEMAAAGRKGHVMTASHFGILHSSEPAVDAAALQQADAAMWRWIDDHDLAGAPGDRARTLATNPALCMALFYPAADTDTLTAISQLVALTFLVDDEFEPADHPDLRHCLAKLTPMLRVIHGHPPADRWSRALADL